MKTFWINFLAWLMFVLGLTAMIIFFALSCENFKPKDWYHIFELIFIFTICYPAISWWTNYFKNILK